MIMPKQVPLSSRIPTIELTFHEGPPDDAMRDLCCRYWAIGDDGKFATTVARLSEDFDIPKHKLAATVARYCTAFTEDRKCIGCGSPRPYVNRTDYEQRRHWAGGGWTCERCVAAQRQEAERARQADITAKRQRLTRDLESLQTDGLSVEDLTLRSAVELVSLARVGGAEDMSYIAPAETFREPLSPTHDLNVQVLRELYEASVLAIYPGCRPEAITLQPESDGYRFDLLKVHWALPVAPDGISPAKFIESVETTLRGDEWPDDWYDEVGDLHRLVALHECIAYLHVIAAEHKFALTVGEKLTAALRVALTCFSVGQVYNFIWGAVKNASAFYLRAGTSMAHAANTIPGSIQRSTERHIAEGWDPKAYRRNFRAPESALSQVLFTMTLRLPEGGLATVPPSPAAQAGA